jgi:hypothetical protein
MQAIGCLSCRPRLRRRHTLRPIHHRFRQNRCRRICIWHRPGHFPCRTTGYNLKIDKIPQDGPHVRLRPEAYKKFLLCCKPKQFPATRYVGCNAGYFKLIDLTKRKYAAGCGDSFNDIGLPVKPMQFRILQGLVCRIKSMINGIAVVITLNTTRNPRAYFTLSAGQTRL